MGGKMQIIVLITLSDLRYNIYEIVNDKLSTAIQ